MELSDRLAPRGWFHHMFDFARLCKSLDVTVRFPCEQTQRITDFTGVTHSWIGSAADFHFQVSYHSRFRLSQPGGVCGKPEGCRAHQPECALVLGKLQRRN